jgi:hypothetical protein
MTDITSPEATNWTLLQKIALRFFFIFFVIFIFFDPNGIMPSADLLGKYYSPVFMKLIPWVGKHILGLPKPITVFTNGSGDTTYDYVWLFTIICISLIGTVIWSITGRNTKNYQKFYFWIWVAIRYYVAFTMLVYGSVKVVKLQFPAPSPGRLLEPVGNMSPMGLAWTYMGYSVGFNWFTGLGEITCGLLLLFRRTSTLGAVIGLAVAGNIMAINYAYDVPVKILATMLVCMCLFILFKDYDRLVNFFFRNREAQPANITPPKFRARWKNIVLCVCKYVLIGFVVISLGMDVYHQNKAFGDNAPKSKFFGIYNVQTFVRGHDTLPPLITDSTRWRRLYIGASGRAATAMMNDSLKNFDLHTDTVKHLFEFITTSDIKDTLKLNYKVLKPDTLLLSGLWGKDSIKVRMAKYDMRKFRLNSRGFHWVNEYPYNK